MYPQCIFGKDCPFHRLLCSLCHGQREHVQLPLVNWHISMNVKGEPVFWAHDIHWRRFRICKIHFLENFGLDEGEILKLGTVHILRNQNFVIFQPPRPLFPYLK